MSKVINHAIYNETLTAYRDGNLAQRTDIVEALIDGENVKALLSHIATVCNDKAEHIASNYAESDGLARKWTKAASMLETLANKLPNDPGIGYGD